MDQFSVIFRAPSMFLWHIQDASQLLLVKESNMRPELQADSLWKVFFPFLKPQVKVIGGQSVFFSRWQTCDPSLHDIKCLSCFYAIFLSLKFPPTASLWNRLVVGLPRNNRRLAFMERWLATWVSQRCPVWYRVLIQAMRFRYLIFYPCVKIVLRLLISQLIYVYIFRITIPLFYISSPFFNLSRC